MPGVLEGSVSGGMLFARILSILDKSVGLYLPLIFEASKQKTTTGRRRRKVPASLVSPICGRPERGNVRAWFVDV